jgi:amino acid permease
MNKNIGEIFLVSGTCIGAATIILPIITYKLGIVISILCFVFSWFLMYLTGLMLMSINFTFPPGTSFISMSREILGKSGEKVSWFFFLALLYSLLVLYIKEGVELIDNLLFSFSAGNSFVNITVSFLMFIIGYIAIQFSALILDRLNRSFMCILLASFAIMISLLVPHVNVANLKLVNIISAHDVSIVLPGILTAFGYQIIIPTLRGFCCNPQELKKVILYGSLISLILYSIWTIMIFLSFPTHGPYSLMNINHSSEPVKSLPIAFSFITKKPSSVNIISCFLFGAIFTSYICIAKSLNDLLKDGLKKFSDFNHGITLLTLLPPFFIIYFKSNVFKIALNYAGLSVAILNGLIPIAMYFFGQERLQKIQQPGIVYFRSIELCLIGFAYILIIVFDLI